MMLRNDLSRLRYRRLPLDAGTPARTTRPPLLVSHEAQAKNGSESPRFAVALAMTAATVLHAAKTPASRVWVVDDNPDICLSLELLLHSDTMNVRAFANAQQLYDAMNAEQPDCLVLDYQLPDADGLAIQTRLGDSDVKIPIVFLTGTADIQAAVAAMRHGAVDFIEKPGTDGQLLAAVTAALLAGRAHQARRRAAVHYGRAIQTLSPREREVLDAISQGLRNKHVARRFDISPRTVETHRENAMRKLQVRNTAELIRVYTMVSTDRNERSPLR